MLDNIPKNNCKIRLLDSCKLFLHPNFKRENLRSINTFGFRMHNFKKLLTIALVFFLSFGAINAQDAAKGGSLFEINCQSCHKVHQKVVGPALAGVYDKYEAEWLYSWIKNSQAMVKAGDPQAVAIYNEYNQQLMTAFPTFSNEDIDNVIEYIRVETDKGPPAAVVDAGGAGGATGSGGSGGFSNTHLFMLFLALVLIGIIFYMSRIIGALGNVQRERQGLPVKELTSGKTIFGSRAVKGLIGLAAFGLLAYTTYDQSSSLSRQNGYQPAQPIKFSHKLHAGQYQIDCQYCHSGAAVGKSAVIPSANVCMNCHKQIQEGPVYGKEEIAKIYKAVGFDPETKKYKEDYVQEPIEWVRIHNLPDHVYFNHAQHVTVGQIECQECHGQIEEMELVEQHSSLGMGWCITCHRETNVQFATNDYYSIYHEYHDEIKNGERSEVKVSDIGGLECQKCHY